MANSEIVDLIIAGTLESFTYMLPVLGLMTGITFIISWIMSLTVGSGRRLFGR